MERLVKIRQQRQQRQVVPLNCPCKSYIDMLSLLSLLSYSLIESNKEMKNTIIINLKQYI